MSQSNDNNGRNRVFEKWMNLPFLHLPVFAAKVIENLKNLKCASMELNETL